jgi:hypothetical protein
MADEQGATWPDQWVTPDGGVSFGGATADDLLIHPEGADDE